MVTNLLCHCSLRRECQCIFHSGLFMPSALLLEGFPPAAVPVRAVHTAYPSHSSWRGYIRATAPWSHPQLLHPRAGGLKFQWRRNGGKTVEHKSAPTSHRATVTEQVSKLFSSLSVCRSVFHSDDSQAVLFGGWVRSLLEQWLQYHFASDLQAIGRQAKSVQRSETTVGTGKASRSRVLHQSVQYQEIFHCQCQRA